MRARNTLRAFQAGLLGGILLAAPVRSLSCPVPTTAHPTVGAAVRDGACTTVALASGTYGENVVIARDVAVSGAGSTTTVIEGRIRIVGAGVDVALASVAVDGTASLVAGCWSDAVTVSGGAHLVNGPDVVVSQTTALAGACRIFVDDFESGGWNAWTSSAP